MGYKDQNKQREFSRLWVKKRREDFFKEKMCVKCGALEKLVLHHIDPKTKISHNIWSWTEEKRNKEISKCEVLCEFCHNEHHAKLKRKEIHGANNMYDKGCRCDKCRKFKSDKNKKFR